MAYITEPLAVLQDDKPLGQTVEEALLERASISADQIVTFQDGGRYFPSPGGVQEEVRSLLVRIAPLFVQRNIKNVSRLSGSGLLRAIEVQQLLRAAQVGGLPSARLEVNVYHLLKKLAREPGPWIGEDIQLADGAAPQSVRTIATLRERPARRVFRRTAREESPCFLALHCAEFEEFGADGAVVSSRQLEFVVPKALSSNTVTTALLRRHGGVVYLGMDDDDLPATQCFSGNSQLLVAPAWRLPQQVRGMGAAKAWVLEQLQREYGLLCGAVWELGGRYHPSPGVTPEAVYPIAVEVISEVGRRRELCWVSLRDAVDNMDDLQDGHLRTVILRAAHALGMLG